MSGRGAARVPKRRQSRRFLVAGREGVRRARAPPSRESNLKSRRRGGYFFFAFFAVFFAFFAVFFAFFAAMILLVPFSAFADPFCFRFVSCRFAGLALRTREVLVGLADAAFAGPPTPLPRCGEADRVLARGRGTASR
jgi:hypothetical protein